MANLKELKIRRKTALSIQRMTSAMKMISQIKFNHMQGKMKQAIAICENLRNLAGRLLFEMKFREMSLEKMFFLQEPAKEAPYLLVILTSDSGLCAGFNQRVIKETLSFVNKMDQENKLIEVICIGKKGVQLLQKFPSIRVINVFTHINEHIFSLTEFISSHFQRGNFSGCSLIYNRFFNILRQEAFCIPLLPMSIEENIQGECVNQALLSYEPDLEKALYEILSCLFPISFHVFVKEHMMSEYGARMAAMDMATDNANQVIHQLKLEYNHLRQDIVTNEIIEIISGCEVIHQ